jgi:hypothetical protein
MESTNKRTQEAAVWRIRRRRMRLECRECEVICERVVSPWRCLKSNCEFVYAYEDDETTYFGCLHKVFSPELDLAAFLNSRGRPGQRSDPYGLIRVSRAPRPCCQVTIEQAYGFPSAVGRCCNPTFFQHPATPSDEAIRLTTKPNSEPKPEPRD